LEYRVVTNIRTPEDLGIAYLGNPHTAIVPTLPKHRIDRAEYGLKLAGMESGEFTSLGYFVPVKNERRKR